MDHQSCFSVFVLWRYGKANKGRSSQDGKIQHQNKSVRGDNGSIKGTVVLWSKIVSSSNWWTILNLMRQLVTFGNGNSFNVSFEVKQDARLVELLYCVIPAAFPLCTLLCCLPVDVQDTRSAPDLEHLLMNKVYSSSVNRRACENTKALYLCSVPPPQPSHSLVLTSISQ